MGVAPMSSGLRNVPPIHSLNSTMSFGPFLMAPFLRPRAAPRREVRLCRFAAKLVVLVLLGPARFNVLAAWHLARLVRAEGALRQPRKHQASRFKGTTPPATVRSIEIEAVRADRADRPAAQRRYPGDGRVNLTLEVFREGVGQIVSQSDRRHRGPPRRSAESPLSKAARLKHSDARGMRRTGSVTEPDRLRRPQMASAEGALSWPIVALPASCETPRMAS